MTEISEQLTNILDKAGWLLPEAVLLTGALLLLMVGVFFRDLPKIILISLYTFIVLLSGAFLVFQYSGIADVSQIYVWDVLVVDYGSFYLQILFLFAAVVYGLSMGDEVDLADLFLALCMVIGAGIVVKAVNLIVLLLGIEILSISAYAFTARQSSGHSGEAGLKYVIFGSVATAIFLYGISLLYGLIGSLDISSEIFTEKLLLQEGAILIFIFVIVLVGIFFKITAFPFHLWAPDVYQIVPAPLAAFFSVVPKVAVIGFLVKLIIVINLFGIIDVPWEPVLAGIAVLTMTLGNLAALSQTDPQRMMAYSSIAHTGFFLLGITAFHVFAYQAVLFYAAIYLCMNFLAFLLIYYYQKRFHIHNIQDFSGKMGAAPFQGIILLIAMISLTGLPPTAGFTSKLLIFSALWQTYQETNEALYWVILIIGILNAVVSLFYYLKIPYFMIFKPARVHTEVKSFAPLKLNFLLIILVLPLLILFIWPDLLMDWINMVNFAL